MGQLGDPVVMHWVGMEGDEAGYCILGIRGTDGYHMNWRFAPGALIESS